MYCDGYVEERFSGRTAAAACAASDNRGESRDTTFLQDERRRRRHHRRGRGRGRRLLYTLLYSSFALHPRKTKRGF